ncbi:hypothetical protein COX24_00315 [bacterium (Candidatus Gribaldobacteria) CG23_combo_of_CG06-09_8_20_14_all_37_87_8]|nr:MAG: hypothetical protein COX24_00315 [bacterium (Candidatus Gribaldobacteria) CG23_combo_of_CG06-09_8_20_14_all_37_87_8]
MNLLFPFEKNWQKKLDNKLDEHLDRESWLRIQLVKWLPWTFRILLAAFISFLFVVFTNYGKQKQSFIYGTTYDPWYAMSLGLNWKTTYLEILDDLGVKYLRLSTFWDQIEPIRDQYYWNDFEWMLNEADKRGVRVIMAIGRKLPRWPECHDPSWLGELNEETLKQEQMEMLKKAVIKLKEHPSIEVWQVENEAFFPFGICPLADPRFVKKEIELVRSLDPNRIIITSDSGEVGNWIIPGYLADKLAISMYRKVRLGWSGYVVWPVPAWYYRLKASLVGLDHNDVWGTELQAEPWAPGPLHLQTKEELEKTMSPKRLINNIQYAKKAGLERVYLWGVEWWAYEKERGNDWYWEYAKKLYKVR